MKRKILWIIFVAVMFFAALGLTLYPVISNYVNRKYASEIYTAYQEAIAQTDDTMLEQERDRAAAYNQALISGNGFTQDDNILRLSDDPDVNDVIKFLREREVVHFQRFGEAVQLLREKLDQKNVYFMNPALDM